MYSVVRRFGYFNVIDADGKEVARFNGPGAKEKAEKFADVKNAGGVEDENSGRGGKARGGRGRGGM